MAGFIPAIQSSLRPARLRIEVRGSRARGLRSNASRFRLLRIFVLRRPGGSSEELEPDPIPNSAVKLLSANGTMAQALGE